MMKKIHSIASAFALVSIAVPASAGPREIPFDTRDSRGAQAFRFSGVTLRLSLDARRAPQPELAVRFAGGTRTDGALPKIGEGLALTATTTAKPRMTIAGQDTQIVGQQLGMSKGTKTALIVGGVVLVAAAVLVATQAGKVPADAYWDE